MVIEGLFEPAAAGGVIFHAATGLDANAIAEVQERARRRLLRTFVRRGLLPGDGARKMAQWEHGGGFSVDAVYGRCWPNWDRHAPAQAAGNCRCQSGGLKNIMTLAVRSSPTC